jgi:anti-sigma-K factor RskA
MEHTELRHLIAAHALDSLEAGDADRVERAIEQDEGLRRELDDLREVVNALAFTAPPLQPPPALRERLLASVTPEPEPKPATERRSWLPWRALSLGLAAGAVALTALSLSLWSQVDDLRDQRDLQAQAVEAIGQPGAEVIKLTGASGSLVRGPAGGVLIVNGLANAPSGRTYQAWIIPKEGAPISAGLFAAAEGTTLHEIDGDLQDAAAVAVTVEDDGGAKAPTSDPFITAPL